MPGLKAYHREKLKMTYMVIYRDLTGKTLVKDDNLVVTLSLLLTNQVQQQFKHFH